QWAARRRSGMITSRLAPSTSTAENPNTASAPRFQTRITPSRSAKITASGVFSTIAWYSAGLGAASDGIAFSDVIGISTKYGAARTAGPFRATINHRPGWAPVQEGRRTEAGGIRAVDDKQRLARQALLETRREAARHHPQVDDGGHQRRRNGIAKKAHHPV